MTPRPHVLFVTYNGLLEPLGLRQGLAYLEPLSDEFRFSVLSFEKTDRVSSPVAWDAMAERLASSAIDWLPMRYHSRPSVPATLYDVWSGVRAARALHRRSPLAAIHARGYIPAAIGWRVQSSAGVPYLFDIRGLMADEYVDGGIWQRGSMPWRLTRWAERRFLRTAAATVTLTEAIRPVVDRRTTEAGRLAPPPSAVIPCCVDTDAFRPDAEARTRIRQALGFGETAPVVVYSGSVGTWYAVEPLVDFYTAFRALLPGARLLLLMNGSDEPIREALATRGIEPSEVVTVRATPSEVPGYLAAADLGIAFIRPSPSKRASSPTKIAEYLASGLPIVVNAGVGDVDQLAGEPAVVVARSLDRASIEAAAAAGVELLGPRTRAEASTAEGDAAGVSAAARALALRAFDLEVLGAQRYRSIYRAMLAGATGRADLPVVGAG